jgi:hypothetical protein
MLADSGPTSEKFSPDKKCPTSILAEGCRPGLPDGIYILKPKIQIWVNFWRAFEWKILYAFWNMLCPLGILNGHLVILFKLSHFGKLCQEKSGNPVADPSF